MPIRRLASAVALYAVFAAPAHAVDFTYSGFSTAAYGQTDTNEARVGYIGQPDGIDKSGSFAIDSKLGLQVTAKFNELVSTTVQGVAYSDLTGDWKPRLDWAYVRVQPFTTLSARVGYIRTPTFMYSDSVFIGYANSWVRPPLEVYNLSPVYQLRGIDVTWRDTVGPVTVSVQPYYGDSRVDVGATKFELDVDRWVGLTVSGEYESFAARAGVSNVGLDSTFPTVEALVDGLRSVPSVFCSACDSEARHLDFKGMAVTLFDVGGQYDDGTNLAILEYAQRRSGSYLIADAHGAYVTLGRRFGGFMPYATLAMSRRDEAMTSNAIVVPAGGPLAVPLATLATSVNSVLATANNDQDSYSVGLRYEVPGFAMLKAAVIKLQFDHIDAKGGIGLLNSVRPGFDGTINLISTSFDFIF